MFLVAAAASVTMAAGAQVPADSVPSFERPNGALMRPATLVYALSLTRPDGAITPLGTRTVSISDAPLGGTPSWLIAEARLGTAVETTDSVSVARADLTPERWAATIGRSQLGASISRDSMFGAIDTYQGRTSFVVAVPSNTLLSAGMVERVIELLPLREGYRSAATLVLIDGLTPRLLSAEIIVERVEGVDVGGRTVECWRVALRSGVLEQRLWVAREGSRVVRTEQAVREGLMTSVLTALDPGP